MVHKALTYKRGAKKLIKRIERSEERAGKSPKEAKRIAYATAVKRGLFRKKKHDPPQHERSWLSEWLGMV